MEDLHQTPLYDLHAENGAKFVPFAGYAMPVQYPLGVLKEHLHTRAEAGLFDVSHMGQVFIEGASWEAVALGFESLIPQDVLGLSDGHQRYGFFTNDAGGIEDDLMFARRGEALFVVVNAACKAADIARMKAALEPELTVRPVEDRALIAIQGPKAGAVVAALDARAVDMSFMQVADLTLGGMNVWASRSGYTGEDGFEISVAQSEAEALVRLLLNADAVELIGLGARDSLRLEAGLCLYGHDIDATTTPVEAGLLWAIQSVRRADGARAGGFPGAETILSQIKNGVSRKRVGLLPEGRAPMREGTELFADDESEVVIGHVTSGGFGPSCGAPVAMGYVSTDLSKSGQNLSGAVRKKRMPLQTAKMPFSPHNFKR